MLTLYVISVIFIYVGFILVTKFLDGTVDLQDIWLGFLCSVLILPAVSLIIIGLVMIYQQNKNKRIW